jgi:hypothetical protein
MYICIVEQPALGVKVSRHSHRSSPAQMSRAGTACDDFKTLY